MPIDILEERAKEYAELNGLKLDLTTPLGHGTDGSVWKSTRKTAVKALARKENYNIELECYKRLKTARIVKLDGFSVPEYLSHNDRLMIIEMRIVTAPFILDFAKSWLDSPPEFSDEQWEYWEEEGHERFDERWDQVKLLVWRLKKYGIYYYDTKPANIRFADDVTS